MGTAVVAPMFGSQGVLSFLRQQLNLLIYGMRPINSTGPRNDQTFASNEDLWEALTKERVLGSGIVHLREFAVTEWLPRTPGLYHDPNAAEQREVAEMFRMPAAQFLNRENRPGKRIGLSHSDKGDRHPASVIYDPYGKSLMIEGGIGCVRLKDISLPRGRTWFLGATSSAGVHEGVPIALADSLYSKYVSDIARGGFVCDMTARIRCIPDDLDPLYRRTRNVPKIYLEVEEDFERIRRYERSGESTKGDWVTGAIGFRVEERQREELLATFTSFVNGDSSSLREAVEWIEEVYVNDVFHGRVVTDFDQRSTRFPGAVFSIDSLFANTVDVTKARELVISVSDAGVSQKIIEEMSRATMKMEVKVDQRVTIGRGARVENSQIATVGSTIAVNSKINQLADQLHAEISKSAQNLPPKRAQELREGATRLRRQLAGKSPKKSSVTGTLNSIAKTASAIGKAGAPIAKLVTTLMTALG